MTILKKISPTLLAFVFIASACQKTWYEAEPANQPEAIFENIWQTFNKDYGPFKERGVDWQAVYNEYRPKVSAQSTDDELYQHLSGMLATLNDGHVNLFAPNRMAFNSNKIRNSRIDDELFDLDLICANYLNGDFVTDADTSYIYALLPERILYLHFPHVGPNMTALGRALDQYPDVKGLIVDLRHNDGGDFTWAFSEMGRLTAERRLVFSSRTKNGPKPDDYTSWHEWYLSPKKTYMDKPIVLLTDRYTISAGERTAMAFQALPNCVSLGDTTCGALSTMVAGELANGWKYTIATQNTLLADGRSCEGIGLAPDIVVKNSLDDLKNGRDQVLEAAVRRLK